MEKYLLKSESVRDGDSYKNFNDTLDDCYRRKFNKSAPFKRASQIISDIIGEEVVYDTNEFAWVFPSEESYLKFIMML